MSMVRERRLDAGTPRPIHPGWSFGDRVFKLVAAAASLSVLAILGLVLLFLCLEALPALRVAGWNFLTAFEWQPDSDPASFGIASITYGTAVIAVIALLVAFPVAVGSALFVNEYASRRLGRPLIALLDLLAAVPSLIYGMWGFVAADLRIRGCGGGPGRVGAVRGGWEIGLDRFRPGDGTSSGRPGGAAHAAGLPGLVACPHGLRTISRNHRR